MDNITPILIPILQAYKARKAAYFGSYARNEQRSESDIDILVELPEELSLLDVIGLQQDLEDATGKHIDLVEYDAIKPLIKQNVLKDSQVFYQQ